MDEGRNERSRNEGDWRISQVERLRSHVAHAATSPLYRQHYLPDMHSLTIDTMDTFVRALPLTTKDELAAVGRDAIAVDPSLIREWVSTSGTSGKPLDVPLTASDLDRLATNEQQALSLAGVQAGDTLLLAVGMERMFVAGLAYWLGAQKIGAACVRLGPQIAAYPDLLADISSRLHPSGRTFIIAVPSYLQNIRPPAGLAGVICIGEPTRSADLSPNLLARHLHARLGVPLLSTYASTETCTTFAESPTCLGNHLNPELTILECLDEFGNTVPDGEIGELVITPFGVRGMPLLRFRTGDLAATYSQPCPCGRTTPRIGPIVSRRQQLLKIRGTSVYPTAILDALRAIPEILESVIVAESEIIGTSPTAENAALSDRLDLHIHVATATPALRESIQQRLRATLRVTPTLHFAEAEVIRTLQASTGSRKPARFIDRRQRR